MVQYHIMKKWKLFISITLFTAGLFVSCTSTPGNKSGIGADASKAKKTEEAVAAPEPTAEELFLQKISDINIEVTKNPSKTKKNKPFGSGYEISVVDSGDNPVSDFPVTVKYPKEKDGSEIVYGEDTLYTDDNGTATFEPQTPDFAASAIVKFYPHVPDGLDIPQEVIDQHTAYGDFAVESDIATKGAIMFVFEYNENGKSPKNSYDILSGLRQKGVYNIGNAPISDASYIDASKEKIYKENYAYVGTSFGYLIGGTVKFTNPVEKNSDGTYTASMAAYIYGIDMKTGMVIYEETTEYSSSGANWNKAVDSCRTTLTNVAVDSIMFGL